MKTLQAASALLRSSVAPPLSRYLSSNITPMIARRTLLPTDTTTGGSYGYTSTRPFTQTSTNYKKKDKEPKGKDLKKGSGGGSGKEPPSTSTTTANEVDPFNLDDITLLFDKADAHHQEELKKLRTGSGQFNADILGALPVQPDKKGSSSSLTFPLRELATVAHLGGRRWSILAFEESSVKPIMSAVQKSNDFNQQPQRSEDNPLELTLTIEPERADALTRRAKETCQLWKNKIRDITHKRDAQNKKWKADKTLTKDDYHLIHEKVQKLQDARMKVIALKEKEALNYITAKAS
ncbi:ribosome recycling factor domain-containing protein [Podospora didyma]|uniref:Ribosome recycling factor domain-containing protein n=1 Tax=Podospora didyma TaxID=330526 RepID=A0AAE0U7V1_9PEZI|nr:ribosome recycling factor domain-containing protein [Podospora didyma]